MCLSVLLPNFVNWRCSLCITLNGINGGVLCELYGVNDYIRYNIMLNPIQFVLHGTVHSHCPLIHSD